MVLALGLLFVFVLWVFHYVLFRPKSKYPFPPGPKGVPLLGNLFQIPTKHLGLWFRGLHRQYGPIIHVRIGGTHLISLGELDVAREVLDKKSVTNSGRPPHTFIDRYVNPDGRYWAFLGSDSKAWKTARRITTQMLHKDRLKESEDFITMEARLTTMHILKSPEHWMEEFERLSTSVAMAPLFGVQGLTGEEPELKEIQTINELINVYIRPNSSIINIFPSLDNLPGKFLPWRRTSTAFQKRQNALYEDLIKEAVTGSRARMNTWCKKLWDAGEEHGDPEGYSLWSGQLFSAASETTSIALTITILAAMFFPEEFEKVYQQIDEVVGSERLPELLDREKLPLVDALVQESLRWQSPGHFGVPHESTDDQIVNIRGIEYVIPKGSILFGTSLAIDTDPVRCPSPELFRLERHLDEKGQLKLQDVTAFGFGRRACPGSQFALRTLWITLASVLWAFHVERQPGHVYNRWGFNGEWTNAPLPFPCVMKPRSDKRVEVLKKAWDLQEKNLEVLLPAPKAK